ncbi:MAG: N-acetylneuraminate synthase [Chthoniobacterales bacterium]
MTEIIAEIGVNHDGSLDRAMEMVRVARECGADSVKFQLFRPADLATSHAQLAEYQERAASGSQVGMLEALALPPSAIAALRTHCVELGVDFLCSPFDLESLRFLTDDLRVEAIKIASGELTNGRLLWQAASSGARILLSTGMAELAEIEEALGAIVFGRRRVAPSGRAALRDAWREIRGALPGVTLLHCTTEYPCPDEDANVKAVATMGDYFGLPVGFSDHTAGWEIPLAAVAAGAVLVEKHFTLDRAAKGPDHAASLEPREFETMVKAIRRVEVALGTGEKIPQPSEIKNRPIARKSLVAAVEIAAGQPFTTENLVAKRPGGGRSPMEHWDLLGQTADRNYRPDELIS